ncbi:MAG: hypothetical protein WBV77_07925 [Solirubrobacteraceae bacterium]|jgi:hypothetical protein
MARTLHVRLDTDSEAALSTMRAEGLNNSQAVRLALIEARARRRQRLALREEASRLAVDADDRRELTALAYDLDVLTETPGQGLEPWAADLATPVSEPNMAPVQAKRPIAHPAESVHDWPKIGPRLSPTSSQT